MSVSEENQEMVPATVLQRFPRVLDTSLCPTAVPDGARHVPLSDSGSRGVLDTALCPTDLDQPQLLKVYNPVLLFVTSKTVCGCSAH